MTKEWDAVATKCEDPRLSADQSVRFAIKEMAHLRMEAVTVIQEQDAKVAKVGQFSLDVQRVWPSGRRKGVSRTPVDS